MPLVDIEKCLYVGVDGCRDGWFAVGFDGDGRYGFDVFCTFQGLTDELCNAKLILVDIPIGLLEGPEERNCDRLARKKLGRPRSSSVFRVPTRKTVEKVAKSPDRKHHENASKYERSQTKGKGLTLQAFYIAPKIAKVDAAIRCNSVVKPPVKEIHPELCFWALHDGKPMMHSKKKPKGRAERLAVLKNVEPQACEIYKQAKGRFRRKDVALDDIIDALAAAVTALCGHDQLQTVPTCPQEDTVLKRPMEMVYWTPESAKEQH